MKYRYRESHEVKDSGVEWLGMIPKEWEVSKLKYNYNFEKGKNAALFTKEYIEMNKGKFPVYSGQTENDGIMGKISSYEYNLEKCIFTTTVGAKVMTPMLLTGKFSLSQNCLIMRNKVEINNSFIYYQLFPLFDYQKSMIPTHMQPSLRIEDLNKFDIFLPTIIIQQKIADFLDKKCEEFDSVIAKKEMLINKLEEAKKSLISEVVTGKVKVIEKENGEYGIIKREDHEMKDSGIEWLGMIPKEWQVSKMKNKLIKFTDGAHISPEVENGVYPFLSVKDLKNGFLDFKNCLKTSIESYKYLKRNSCKPERGDLLISKDGTIGKTCLIDFDKEFVVASSLVIIKSNKNFSIKFLDYILQSEASQKQIFQYVKGAALPRISLELLKNIYIPFINQQDEQIKINNLLDKKCSQFDITIEKQKESIEKLKLAKQSLISEAVTGKIEIL